MQFESKRARSELEAGHAVRFENRASAGVGQGDDVAEHLVDGFRIALPSARDRCRGELLQLANQDLELLVARPVLAKRGVLRRPARLQNRA